MPTFSTSTAVLTVAIVLLLARPALAFGAGNIASVAKIEGSNWRHGDIEDTLLTLMLSRAAGGKKFDKMNVARVYFGNWLRDYSQAIDVGTVKYVSAEAIRILLWVLGFMTFGFGTKEFEVTTERLGCYRPEDHIDNPKDYADNIDATQYDRRLRGPVNERVELAIDPRTGLKNYIANEHVGIMTSALHVRKLFTRCIQLGRSYARSNNKDEFYESLRLLGTALHCLEDYSAHSNYTELALIEMGERNVFPHVGRRTQIRLQGARSEVYPVVTGTFGGVDFLHSVMGEFSDKATQSEIQELEGTIQNEAGGDTSLLKDLLDNIPKGIFGDTDEASKADELQSNAVAAQMNQVRVSPREPEEFTIQMQEVAKQIKPIMQWHDEIMLSITETIEKIPILPDLIEQLEGQVNMFVFSLIAPFVLPIIDQIKTELNTGSSEIIQSSKDKQLIVFHDDSCSDPTHSMLSKDHFSNVLNEPAGKIASQVLKWVVPQIIECMDNERVDVDRTINRIINGVFHHPAQRNQGEDGASDGRRLMFGVVERWWQSKDQYEQQNLRRQLSREGVENGENHKEGVEDSGHGCGKPLGMAKKAPSAGSNTAASALMGGLSSALGGNSSSGGFGSSSGGYGGSSGGYGGGGGGFGGSNQVSDGIGKFAGEAAGGGVLGGLVGTLAGGLGGSLLSGAFGGSSDEPETKKYSNQGYTPQGNYQQTATEYGRSGNQYAQAQYTETQRPDGGRVQDYQRYEQTNEGFGSGFEQHTEVRPSYGGGYDQSENRRDRRDSGEKHRHRSHSRDSDDSDKKHRHRSHSRGSNHSGKKHHKRSPSRERFEERRERFEEPPRQEYGGGYTEGRGGGYGEERREEYGGRGDGGFGGGGFGGGGYGQREEGGYGGGRGDGGYGAVPGGFEGGNEAGWGERERDEEPRYERRDEYGEERREEGGGGWFS